MIRVWEEGTRGLTVYDGYGQTETVNLVANYRCVPVRPGSMGKPTPGFDVQVVDEAGSPVKPGEEGHIAVRVAPERPIGMFGGYYLDDDATAAAFHGGWYFTGDKGRCDEDGYFWFEGRSDDVITSSAYRIGPFEVESALIEHPAVAEAAVVGKDDPERTQLVTAFVICAPGYEGSDALAKELQAHVKKTTAPYKYPRLVYFVDELPKTVSGKIRRTELRDQLRSSAVSLGRLELGKIAQVARRGRRGGLPLRALSVGSPAARSGENCSVTLFRQALLVAGKDLRIEARSRVALNQVLPFAGIILLLFAFALDPDRGLLAPGGARPVLGGRAPGRPAGRLPGLRRRGGERGARRPAAVGPRRRGGLLRQGDGHRRPAPGPRGGPRVRRRRALRPAPPQPAGGAWRPALIATAGLAAAGTVYGVLAAGLRVRETLFPLLVLPVVAPVMLGATRAWEAALDGAPSEAWPWVQLLACSG